MAPHNRPLHCPACQSQCCQKQHRLSPWLWQRDGQKGGRLGLPRRVSPEIGAHVQHSVALERPPSASAPWFPPFVLEAGLMAEDTSMPPIPPLLQLHRLGGASGRPEYHVITHSPFAPIRLFLLYYSPFVSPSLPTAVDRPTGMREWLKRLVTNGARKKKNYFRAGRSFWSRGDLRK